VSEWEYRKIALNQLPRKTDDIDLLCEAGLDGWELVAILANNVAYFKRQVGHSVTETMEHIGGAIGRVADADTHGSGNGASVEVKPKYRDPKTSETWSGRGRMASWLKRKQDAGEDISTSTSEALLARGALRPAFKYVGIAFDGAGREYAHRQE
jgi:H-NS histone family